MFRGFSQLFSKENKDLRKRLYLTLITILFLIYFIVFLSIFCYNLKEINSLWEVYI